jgi:hypothetical protein
MKMIAKELSLDCARFEALLDELGSAPTQAATLPAAALAHAELCDECARLFLGKLLKSHSAPGGNKVARE